MSFTLPTALPAWRQLSQLAADGQPHLRELLRADPERRQRMSFGVAGLTLDASLQRITPAVSLALLALAEQSELAQQRDAWFSGAAVNRSEGRAALHVALRGDPTRPGPWGASISAQVQRELQRVCNFAEQLRAMAVRGHSGAAITDVVNLGVGGSDLGPRMATEALAHLAHPGLRVHYVSNPDAWALWSVLRGLDASRTLFVVSSKSFTTPETLTNAASAQRWLLDHGCPAQALADHLVAVTAQPALAAQHGYRADRTFLLWDWVGGRYSIWSAIGLPLAAAIGAAHFHDFLAGARAIDEHFCHAPLARNLPVLLALHGIWNRNFLQLPTQLFAPYPYRLLRWTPFVQQLDMESNGKRCHSDGRPVALCTGPIVWGDLGIQAQHAYFQLIHQGQHTVPVDFIGVLSEDTPLPLAPSHHALINRNLRAQASAMAEGRSPGTTQALLEQSGLTPAQAQAKAAERSFEGNIPSHSIWLDRLDPACLGALIALYEHKVFCQAAIWRINPFDQWGVELGKSIAQAMESEPVLLPS